MDLRKILLITALLGSERALAFPTLSFLAAHQQKTAAAAVCRAATVVQDIDLEELSICDDAAEERIPLSVQRYLAHVKDDGLRYAPAGHPCFCSTYPGKSLDRAKDGACDEFALNALYHLIDAPDLVDLVLVSYWGKDDHMRKDCSGKMTDEEGHAFVAYKTKSGRWHSVSDGQEDDFTSSSLMDLIETSAKRYKFLTLTTAKAIPRTVLQQPIYRQNLLEDDRLIDVRHDLLYSPHFRLYEGEINLQ